jgi:hypothetical protein
MLVSVRFNEKDVSYLQALAKEKGKSMGKILQDLVTHCRENSIGQSEEMRQNGDRITQMLEEIHLAIPHLIYMNRTVFNCWAHKVGNKEFTAMRTASLEKTGAICGGFQSMNYRLTGVSMNDNGLQTLPIETENSQWRAVQTHGQKQS